MSEKYKILDIPFTGLSEAEILGLLQEHCARAQPEQLFLATPNPEILLAAINNGKLKQIISGQSFNIPDGNGIIWANYYLRTSRKIRSKMLLAIWGVISLLAFAFRSKNSDKPFSKAIHGSDLSMQICLDPQLCRQGVFLLGNSLGLASNTATLAARKLLQLNPALIISGHLDCPADSASAVKEINKSGAKILLVAFGAPAQEIWLAENLPQLQHLKIAMGVGGTFDFIAGIMPRAPLWMRKTGLEWLYRLYRQPRKRLKRIFNALVVFPSTIIKKRIAEKK